MLASRRVLNHPAYGPIDLPMLVPAFSSKGFPLIRKNGRKCSEVTNALAGTRTIIKESILLSAYDIQHRLIQRPTCYFEDKVLVFIDSGGYELASDWDSTEPKQGKYTSMPFTEEDYRRVLTSLPEHIPYAVANYDWGTKSHSMKNQIRAAQRLFGDYDDRRFLTIFIIKPGRRRYLNIDDIRVHSENLRTFNCIGVVEKELGGDLMTRLRNVAALRMELEAKRMNTPIHVWGGLDPIISPLYFFAGADIFDGVSWLRYAYHSGMAVSREAHCVLSSQMGLQTPGEHAKALTLSHNLTFMGRLKTALERFADERGRTFKMFDDLADARSVRLSEVFKRAYDVLRASIPEMGGGA